ncbi:MBL fold metallo-hydrolase [Streptomyces sp. PH10-H1]|uniref:MBL fold metallo-hydrolase n=1 Tax=Streptomyces sp. PH10-H1 TaxID=3046212 RepID=UPI0032D95F03
MNATPDIGDQIEDCPELCPGPGARQTPLAGLVLTDAELDHTLGIARLREARGLEVIATRPVRHALLIGLRLGAVLSPYTDLEWRDLGAEAEPLAEGSAVEINAIRTGSPGGAPSPRRNARPDWSASAACRSA